MSKKSSFEDALMESTDEKTYMDIPFDESQDAKAMGARWDKDEKKWYISKDNKNYKKLVKSYPLDEKVFLSVPYSEKDEAKELGARWDKDEKKWYTTKKNINNFDKWT